MACTCFSVSDDEEEGVVRHDLWVQHQRPRQCNHACRRAHDSGSVQKDTYVKAELTTLCDD